jgi:hypothetical protein
VTTNDGDGLAGGVGLLDLGDEAGGTDDIEGGDTEETLGVVDTAGLVDLGDDGDGGVDLLNVREVDKMIISTTYGVGNDQDVSLGGGLSGGLGEVADDRGVGVEEVITGHTGLTGNTSGDQDDLGVLEAVTETAGIGVVASDGAVGVDVAEISSDTCQESDNAMRCDRCHHTGSTADIVEGELRNTGVELQEQGQRLANTTGGTENGDLGGLRKRLELSKALIDKHTLLAEAEKARFWKRLTVRRAANMTAMMRDVEEKRKGKGRFR